MLGDKIKELRKAHGISQEQFANIMGLTRSTIYKYERNERMPDLGTITRMAEYFGVSLDYICDRKPMAKEKLAHKIIAMFDRKGLIEKDAENQTLISILNIVDFVLDEFCKLPKR